LLKKKRKILHLEKVGVFPSFSTKPMSQNLYTKKIENSSEEQTLQHVKFVTKKLPKIREYNNEASTSTKYKITKRIQTSLG